MVCTWISRWARGRSARTQAPSTVSVSSSHDSPTATPTSEPVEPQEAQGTLDPQELQKPQAPSLVLLPTELVLLVSELLPTADAVCLGLTCKGMYYILNIPDLGRRLDVDVVEILLGRLESEITGVSYCCVGQRLARFTTCTLAKRYFIFHCHFHTARKSRGPLDVNFGLSLFYLSWCAARTVTNYQIHGPQHGLPASSLASMYDHQDQEHGVYWKEAWTAKLIHGELLVSCTHTFFHESADAGKLQTYFNTNTIAVCRHLRLSAARHYQPNVKKLHISMIGNTEQHDMGWCWKCETDWETSTEWTDTERGWTVTARTYHGLGTCRSPHDPKWQAMSSSFKRFRAVPGSAVKALWDKV
ncbi:hypothetical protein F5Y06DRAFT_303693 [Hypoxylon sp. FL0890]|nr:hypothetical protein F5Y06DRAFT_303693 [Hypoxylon sp. FL0890]